MDDTGRASEFSPLLQTGVEDEPNTKSGLVQEKRHVSWLLCAFAFTIILSSHLQSAALIQVFEQVIFDEYYHADPPPFTSHDAASPAVPGPEGNRCKAQAVQTELARVRGIQQLVPLFAALLCTLPYGLLAERIGRKRVLILSSAGIFASFSWLLAVCYWRFAPIRWVWFSGVFLFIGGGDAVASSTVLVMVTDTTEQAKRAQIFLFLRAAEVVSGFFGPGISGAIMEAGHTWTVLLLAEVVLFFGTFVLTQFIPETLHARNRPKTASRSERAAAVTASDSTKPETSSLLALNQQAVLLLCILTPQQASRTAFDAVGLQYSSANFDLSYSRSNGLLSVFQGTQSLAALVLLPLFTRLVAAPCGWSTWVRDRIYATISITVTAAGLMVIAVAPVLAIEVAGLVLVGLGSCTTGLLLSLRGRAVRPSQVSAVYGLALMLGIAAQSVLGGPVANAFFVKGLELGWKWMGLLFAAMAVVMAGLVIAGGYIATEPGDLDEEDEE